MKQLLASVLLAGFAVTAVAQPVSVPENVAVSKEAAVSGSDTQVFINKTSRKLTLSVGDFFPSDYNIKSGETIYVYVSSNNQTVKIKDAN
jgi:hypothetical protein